MPLDVHPRPDWTGLLLAGGASDRMGSDKASLRVDEAHASTLGQRALDLLLAACGQALVLGGPESLVAGHTHAHYLADAEAQAGPIPALAGGLRASTTPWCVVIPVDMPAITLDLIRVGMGLVDRHPVGDAPGYFAADQVNRGCFPLWLHRDARPGLEDSSEGRSRSLFARLFELGAASWNPPTSLDFPGGDFSLNLNTPEEYAAWQAGLTTRTQA